MEIGAYTLRQWGEAQTSKYLDDLEACCRALAASPALGCTCDEIRPGLRRMECGRHVVFYRQAARGVFILRILHRSMLPERHSLDDQDDTE